MHKSALGVLAELAPQLPDTLRQAALREALDATNVELARVLAQLATHWPDAGYQAFLDGALTAARAISDFEFFCVYHFATSAFMSGRLIHR
jgi:hypothetical protein